MVRPLFLALLLLAPGAQAASILYQQDARVIAVIVRYCDPWECEPGYTLEERPEPLAAEWNGDLSALGITLSMESRLGENEMSMSGRATTTAPFCYDVCTLIGGAADIGVQFMVSEATPFVFTGIAPSNYDRPQIGEIVEGPFGPLAVVRYRAPNDGAFVLTGTLLPDRIYTFDAVAIVGATPEPLTSYVEARLLLTPEPASALLVALGLAATGMARRLPRRRPRPR